MERFGEKVDDIIRMVKQTCVIVSYAFLVLDEQISHARKVSPIDHANLHASSWALPVRFRSHLGRCPMEHHHRSTLHTGKYNSHRFPPQSSLSETECYLPISPPEP